MMNDLEKIFSSVRFAVKGLRHAYRIDKSFRMEVHYGLPIYFVVGWLLAPFSTNELLWYVFSYLFILVCELVNTTFEKILDMHPSEHPELGRNKDIASAPMLLAFLFAIIVVLALICARLAKGTFVLGAVFV